MHFISGTTFKVNKYSIKAHPKTKLFEDGIYKLLTIRKKDNKFEYNFVKENRTQLKVEFTTCREADEFIALCLNKPLPVTMYSNLDL